MVEHTTHNRVVGGSNPPTATSLLDSLRNSHLLDPAGMLVALSGGPDSTALLLGLLEVGIKVKAAHFDHALRPESAAEALTVADFCRAHGVELVSGIRRAPLAKGSLQAAARAARYRFLEEASAASGLATVALGHTADDLVEERSCTCSEAPGWRACVACRSAADPSSAPCSKSGAPRSKSSSPIVR